MITSPFLRSSTTQETVRAALVAAALPLLILAGCGGGAGNKDEFIDSYIAKYCENIVCSETAKTTVDGCKAGLSRAVKGSPYTDPKISYDSAAGQACLDAVAASGCSSTLSQDASQKCKLAFSAPDATEGKACVQGLCANSSLYCASSMACGGICKAIAAEGGSCTSSEGCASGLFCEASSQTCRKRLAEGQSCLFSGDCAEGLSCDQDPNTFEMTCAKPKDQKGALGETCTPYGCVTGAYCDLATSKCVGPAKAGQKCTQTLPDSCEGANHCKDGTCSPLLKLGAPCTEVDACEAFTYCIDGACAYRKEVGEACKENIDCNSYRCGSAGTCESATQCGP